MPRPGSFLLPPLRPLSRGTDPASDPASTRLLADLHDGTASLADLLDSPDAVARRLLVIDVLAALPELGPDRACRLMADLRIHRLRRVRALNASQKQRLVALFPKP